MNIFIGNLSHMTSEKELNDLFTPFGPVKSVKIVTDNFTKRPRGFAFVEMDSYDAGTKAIEQLNQTRVHEQAIVVNEARPKSTDSAAGFGRRHY